MSDAPLPPAPRSPGTLPDASAPATAPPARHEHRARKWLLRLLRWAIAIFGIGYVLSNISWNDRVLLSDARDGWPVPYVLAAPATEDSPAFSVREPKGGIRIVDRAALLVKSDAARIQVRNNDGSVSSYDVLAQKVVPNRDRARWPLVVCTPRNYWQRYWNKHVGAARVVEPRQIVGPRPSGLTYPLIDRGIGPMVAHADRWLLFCAVAIFPICFLLTSWRWYLLLRALDISMTLPRTFVINMVGAFYNTFLPGSTGGDVLKMIYAAKQTPHRTRAVMSVIVDRVIGLLALVLLGGSAAVYQYIVTTPDDPSHHAVGKIALGSWLILVGTATALLIFYTPLLRRITGLDFILRRLPMQRHVAKAIETMEIYKRHPMLILTAVLMTLPVHGTVVLSATLSGMALGLPLAARYYWVVVPVVVLAGSIPISPQGAGVMEFFAILLTRRQGCTVAQAFALTMSIRLVQILWNLTGGLFVLRGGFHVPTAGEQKTLQEDETSVVRSEVVATSA
jgi:uncharacterized protein (TIRG00374 family)